ncbi:MAG: degt/dnrj/eryc1/strs aminotransferase, perosamine synthetase [Candidatus Peregrinibacteria bacterium GW2011_GWF2_43_17]|nr:MAG: degt/dnrj/eryc1/strs aminotransferase, perosamine synthetase [Candidatus Peregrinibacteria bacterium GW2011_GWF2_43_17]KKT19629.1 MAG: DegT/DnrJ/EryC1/StrS aminotransferase [Candidatus Peregrinibacteria bacterium GW2011_GWA2_43_8]HAU40078.1 hypothetical protein [Candidatus Peregrinibacteria bacterium]
MVKNSSKFIPQIEPWFDDDEIKELTEVMKSTFVTESSKTQELEAMIAKYTGSKYVVSYMNGTMAIFAALKTLGIGAGDEVIVPDMTFIATANAVILTGAKPVFCDIDPETLQMTREQAEKKITSHTKAIIPVHLYGGAVQMDEILELAKKHNLHVVEDAAQGIGVKLNGRHVGTFGDVGILSFYGNKTITMGEGGMILTASKELAEECYAFKNHGRKIKGIFTHEKIGYNFSTTDLNAAIGIAQMRKLDKVIKRKKEIMDMYKKLLKNVYLYDYPKNVDCVPWFTSIKVENPEKLAAFMKENNIGMRRFFYPLHLQPCYKNEVFGADEFRNSTDAYEHGISLPSSATLEDEQVEFVASKINDFYKG